MVVHTICINVSLITVEAKWEVFVFERLSPILQNVCGIMNSCKFSI